MRTPWYWSESSMVSLRCFRSLAWDLGEMASAAGWVDRDTLLVATETGLRRFLPIYPSSCNYPTSL